MAPGLLENVLGRVIACRGDERAAREQGAAGHKRGAACPPFIRGQFRFLQSSAPIPWSAPAIVQYCTKGQLAAPVRPEGIDRAVSTLQNSRRNPKERQQMDANIMQHLQVLVDKQDILELNNAYFNAAYRRDMLKMRQLYHAALAWPAASKPRVNLTRYHGVLACAARSRSAPAAVDLPGSSSRRRTGVSRTRTASTGSWITCARKNGKHRLGHCCYHAPVTTRLLPPSIAPPGTLALFAGKDSSTTALHQQGSQ